MGIIGMTVEGIDTKNFRRKVRGEVVHTLVTKSTLGSAPFVLYLVVADRQGKIHYVVADHEYTTILKAPKKRSLLTDRWD